MKIDVWFPSNTYTVLDSINIRKKINTAIRDIYKRYDSVMIWNELQGYQNSFVIFIIHGYYFSGSGAQVLIVINFKLH